jgi:hypothetical protein
MDAGTTLEVRLGFVQVRDLGLDLSVALEFRQSFHQSLGLHLAEEDGGGMRMFNGGASKRVQLVSLGYTCTASRWSAAIAASVSACSVPCSSPSPLDSASASVVRENVAESCRRRAWASAALA